MRLRLFTLSVCTALAVVAALQGGCAHTRRVASDRVLRIALTEYRLNPGSASVTFGTVTILIHNYGRLTHNLVLSENGQSIASSKGIAPGQSAELDVSLAPGKYILRSTVLSDEALGMFGTLTVS